MLTLDLKKSNDNLVVHGKLIVYLSTNVSQPISNPGPSAVNGLTAALANMGLDDNTNLSPAGPSPSGNALSRTPSHQGGQATPQPETQATIQMPTPQINRSPTATASGGPGAENEPTATPASRPVSGALTVNTAQNASVNPSTSPTNTTTGPAQVQSAVPAGAQTSAAPVTRNFNPTEDHIGPLPTGWERRIDPLGRTYYVDHQYAAHSVVAPTCHLLTSSLTLFVIFELQNPQHDLAQAVDESDRKQQRTARRDQCCARSAQSTGARGRHGGYDGQPGSVGVCHAHCDDSADDSWEWASSGWVEERFTPEGRAYYVDITCI